MLARAGSVVCAKSFVLFPFDLHVSMRISDSRATGRVGRGRAPLAESRGQVGRLGRRARLHVRAPVRGALSPRPRGRGRRRQVLVRAARARVGGQPVHPSARSSATAPTPATGRGRRARRRAHPRRANGARRTDRADRVLPRPGGAHRLVDRAGGPRAGGPDRSRLLARRERHRFASWRPTNRLRRASSGSPGPPTRRFRASTSCATRST